MEYYEILERQKSLFLEILALTERQLLLLRSGSKSDDEIIEIFGSLIDERQQFMDAIDSLPYQPKNDSSLNQEIHAIIAAIQKNDNYIKDAGQKILTLMGEQLNLAKTTKQAYAAYHYEDSPHSKGWFIDSKK